MASEMMVIGVRGWVSNGFCKEKGDFLFTVEGRFEFAFSYKFISGYTVCADVFGVGVGVGVQSCGNPFPLQNQRSGGGKPAKERTGLKPEEYRYFHIRLLVF
jgi:hypothetical protein